MIFKHKFFVGLALSSSLAFLSAPTASASLLGDEVQVDVNFSVDNPIGAGTLPIAFSDLVTVVHPGFEVDEDLTFATVAIDVNPIAETIEISVENLTALSATNITGSAMFSDLDWLDAGGGPIAGIVSGASISSNPGSLPFSVSNTDDSITLNIDSPFDITAFATVSLTISYSAEHIPEPTSATLALAGLSGLAMLLHRRQRK